MVLAGVTVAVAVVVRISEVLEDRQLPLVGQVVAVGLKAQTRDKVVREVREEQDLLDFSY